MQLSEKIFDKTNGGKDIITEIYPESNIGFENIKKAFKIRNESTASARVKNIKGVWVLTDFGGDGVSRNGIQVYMQKEMCDYSTALHELAKRYHIDGTKPTALVDFETTKEAAGYTFDFKKELSITDLHIIGPQVDESVTSIVNLKVCNSFVQITDKGKKITTTASVDYPVFVFDFGSWKKIYQPLNPEKQYRFRYVGTKPKNYIFGLDNVLDLQRLHEKKINTLCKKELRSPKKNELKLDSVIIAAGDRDGLNLMSFGYHVIWLTSESDRLNFSDYAKLLKAFKNVYVLPDIDKTGKRQAIQMALKYSEIKIIWLPEKLTLLKDFRGNPLKDFRDYVQKNYFGDRDKFIKRFDNLKQNALPMRFWDAFWNPKSEETNYKFNNSFAIHFMKHQGFYVYEEAQQKDDYGFVYVQNNVVERVKAHHIKKNLLNFLEVRNESIELRNLLHRTTQMSSKHLSQLDPIALDFTKGTATSQLFFFNKKTWKITKTGITELKPEDVKNKVWKDNIIDFDPKVQEAHFLITKKKGSDLFDIEIKNKESKYLNFMINSSRVHWKSEDKNLAFEIASPELTEEQREEQKLHLVNKIYTIGYLLHSYKDSGKAWAVYNMDYEIVEDAASQGGTGKSLFFKMLNPILKNVKRIEGRQKGLADKDFLFDGITDDTDLMLIDDADMYLRFNRFFTSITGDMQVNPKGSTPYEVAFENAPKIAVSSNFGMADVDTSTLRRLLYVLTSDYYHDKNELNPTTRQVLDDFNGAKLIDDFNDQDWHDYYNFAAQCISFFLSQKKRIDPPMENVTKRGLIREMRIPFKGWADMYFTDEMFNINITKESLMKEFELAEKGLKTSSSRFKKALNAWCKFNGFVMNPPEKLDKSGRIVAKDEHNKTKEMIYIKNINAENSNHLYEDDNFV